MFSKKPEPPAPPPQKTFRLTLDDVMADPFLTEIYLNAIRGMSERSYINEIESNAFTVVFMAAQRLTKYQDRWGYAT